MLLPTHDRSRAWQLLSGLVLLALCSNASAWVFCPHLSGSSRHCFDRNSVSQSHDVADRSTEHMHHEGMDMSEMGNADVSMDRADVVLPFTDATRLELVSDEFIAQPIESCSHCMMHSQSQANSPLRTVAISTSPSDVTGSAVTVVNALAAISSFVEVHDHGPPGSSIARYVLVGAFRI